MPNVTLFHWLTASLVWLVHTVPGATDAAVGSFVGLWLGICEGSIDGAVVESIVWLGNSGGRFEGAMEGMMVVVGCRFGNCVGTFDGAAVVHVKEKEDEGSSQKKRNKMIVQMIDNFMDLYYKVQLSLSIFSWKQIPANSRSRFLISCSANRL